MSSMVQRTKRQENEFCCRKQLNRSFFLMWGITEINATFLSGIANFWSWKTRMPSEESSEELNSISPLLQLVRLHVICRNEVYPLCDLRFAYESLKAPDCPSLRSCDIKAALVEKFPTDIMIESSIHSSNRGSEYAFPSRKSLTPDVMEAASSGFGLSKWAVFRSAAHRLHHELLKRQIKKNNGHQLLKISLLITIHCGHN